MLRILGETLISISNSIKRKTNDSKKKPQSLQGSSRSDIDEFIKTQEVDILEPINEVLNESNVQPIVENIQQTIEKSISQQTIEKSISQQKPIFENVPDDNMFKLSQNTLEDLKKYTRHINILVSSTQFPGNGGAATNSYYITKYFRQHVSANTLLLFNESFNVLKSNESFDPDFIGGVFNVPRIKKATKEHLESTIDRIHGRLSENIHLAFGKNYITPVLNRILFPQAINVYLVSGSLQGSKSADNNIPITELLAGPPEEYSKYVADRYITDESKANESADFITANSELSNNTFKKCYPDFVNKITDIIDTTGFVGQEYKRIENTDRIYDILYTASRVDRSVKGWKIAKEILNHDRLKNYSKLVIGGNSSVMSGTESSNMTCIERVDAEVLQEYMAKSKTFIQTSLFEASSNCMREAMVQGCEIITTKNVGWYSFFDESTNIVNDIKNIDEWVDKIINNIENFKGPVNHKTVTMENLEYNTVNTCFNYVKPILCSFTTTISELQYKSMIVLKSSTIIQPKDHDILKSPDVMLALEIYPDLKKVRRGDNLFKSYLNNILPLIDINSPHTSFYYFRYDQIKETISEEYYNLLKTIWENRNLYIIASKKYNYGTLFDKCNKFETIGTVQDLQKNNISVDSSNLVITITDTIEVPTEAIKLGYQVIQLVPCVFTLYKKFTSTSNSVS